MNNSGGVKELIHLTEAANSARIHQDTDGQK
jgi:hypothetical protein